MCPIFMIEQGTIQITGDSATAECYDGYEVSMGDVVRYCQQNYTWSGTEPQCTRELVTYISGKFRHRFWNSMETLKAG